MLIKHIALIDQSQVNSKFRLLELNFWWLNVSSLIFNLCPVLQPPHNDCIHLQGILSLWSDIPPVDVSGGLSQLGFIVVETERPQFEVFNGNIDNIKHTLYQLISLVHILSPQIEWAFTTWYPLILIMF